MDRRAFLGTVTAATLLSNRLTWALADHKIDKIGVQLYTVRFAMKQDFEGSLAKVAAIGYKEAELAEFAQAADGTVTYFGRSPADMRAALDRHGLTSPSTHVKYSSLSPENFPKVIEASHVLGNEYIVMPWIEEVDRKQPDIWKKASAVFNRAGEACKKAGIQFAYHNHWFEFLPVNGKRPYDVLLEETDPKLVKMEMDVCWITVAGGDPLAYFNRYPGRFPLVHAKDTKAIPSMSAAGAQNFGDTFADMADVGSGIIDWKKIFAQSDKAGIKHYFVEYDKPKAPFESIANSYEYLEKLRF
jgi:sugar phosphate isomerase/epimerase